MNKRLRDRCVTSVELIPGTDTRVLENVTNIKVENEERKREENTTEQ